MDAFLVMRAFLKGLSKIPPPCGGAWKPHGAPTAPPPSSKN